MNGRRNIDLELIHEAKSEKVRSTLRRSRYKRHYGPSGCCTFSRSIRDLHTASHTNLHVSVPHEPSNACLSPSGAPPLPEAAYNTKAWPIAITALLMHAHPTRGYHTCTSQRKPRSLIFRGTWNLKNHDTARAKKVMAWSSDAVLFNADGPRVVSLAWSAKATPVAIVMMGLMRY
jgi:hypothetical protein